MSALSAPGARFLVLQQGVRLAVVLLGFAALYMGGELGGFRAAVAALAVALSCWPGRPRMEPRNWLFLQVLFLLWLIFGAAVLHRHLVTLFAELLVFVQVHRLLSRSRARDDLYLSFIAFGQVLIASVLTMHLLYLLLFGAFVVAVAWSLLLCRLAVTAERHDRAGAAGQPLPVSAYAALDGFTAARPLLCGVLLAAVLLGSTSALFFILPRMQASFLDAGLVNPLHVSGFSERVHLGDVGSLKLSAKPVMRVKVHDRQGTALVSGGLYWHGLALDRFDGRNWELSEQRRIGLSTLAPSGFNGPPRERPWTLRQEITLEPLDSDVMFYVADPVAIYGVRRLEAVATEGYYLVSGARRGSGGRLRYTVYSQPRMPDAQQLRSEDPADSNAELLARYTQLPSQSPPRIAEIAAQWTAGTASAVDAALVIQDRLRRDYSYSLDQEASAYADPVLAFLDEVKEGHCEYYASAMALLLRTRGIPTRMVNGFYGGEWNPVGEYWLIRQRDAHSWVEVHFPGSGWVIFDPTPSVGAGLTGLTRFQLIAQLRLWSDYAELVWEDVLLDYGLDTQVEGVRSLVRALQGWGSAGERRRGLLSRILTRVAPGDSADGKEGGAGIGWLLLLAVALPLLAWGLLARVGPLARRGQGSASERRLRILVTRLESSWAKAGGLESRPPQARTPLAWAQWAAQRDPSRFSSAPGAIERYYQVRFGGAEPSLELALELRRMGRRSRAWKPAPYSKLSDQNSSVS